MLVLYSLQIFKGQEEFRQDIESKRETFPGSGAQAADVIEAVTNSGIKYDEKEAAVDVCQAIQEIRQEERRLGEKDGELKKAREAAPNFYNLGIEVDKIAQGVGYALETVKEWLEIE